MRERKDIPYNTILENERRYFPRLAAMLNERYGLDIQRPETKK